MGGGSKKQVTGHKYYMGLHFAICQGPVDVLTEIRVGDRIAWSGWQTGNGTVSIAAPQLFGGDKKEGGIEGSGDVMLGGPSQGQNSYMTSKVSASVPAYRGIMSFVWKAGLVAANNPYIKPWSFRVRRILHGWGTDVWYSATATIGTDMNPAHIIYQCLTDPNWGMGYPIQQVDSASFTAVADTLFSESFGLSLLWNQQEEIGKFVGGILDHIGAVLYTDPTTGKFAIKLIRGDYDPDTLETFTPDNAHLDSFQRVAYGDTVNEITVVFKDAATGKDSAVTVQDLANVQAQGAVVSQTKQYPGITNSTIAARVAMRDLIATSTPLAKITMRVNRDGWSKIPGDVFKITWPKFGLSSLVCRVLSADYGSLTDGEITITAAEDVYGLPASAYASQQASGFTEPTGDPVAATVQEANEAAYYQIATTMSAGDFGALDAVDCAFVTTMAGRPSGLSTEYSVWSKVGATAYEDRGGGSAFTPYAELAASIGPGATSLTYTGDVDIDQVLTGKLGWVGTGATAEAVEVLTIDTGTTTITVKRGCLDTVPRSHSSGARLWFPGDTYIGFDPVERATSETVDVKLTTIATGGELDIDDASAMTVTCDQRFARPYPPGTVRINTEAYPTYIVGALTVSWAHRDRTLQTAGLIGDGDGNVGPEVGVTYTLRLYDETDTLRRTETSITGTSYTWSTEEADSLLSGRLNHTLRIELEAERSGLASWQTHDIAVDRAGWGYNYGLYYGAGA